MLNASMVSKNVECGASMDMVSDFKKREGVDDIDHDVWLF